MSGGAPAGAGEPLELLDWRRAVADLYAAVRAMEPGAGWQRWRSRRDELFAGHPQSPIPAGRRSAFAGLAYFPYDPAWRVEARIEPAPPQPIALPSSGAEPVVATRFGVARFELRGTGLALDAFWLPGYAGGLFVAMRDASSGGETYAAGRYLLDTAKGADLGGERDRLVLDLNFAYQPSCSYDPRWACPLAPPGSRLELAVTAGERLA